MTGTNYLNADKGLFSWLTTLDHKRIGILYMAFILSAFFVGGVMAMIMRLELGAPGADFLEADTYNRFFTMHGVVMVFLFLIPGIPATLGNFLLPMMIGAKNVAFPRINLASWYIYVVGTTLVLWTLARGGIDTGWTFYTPYSTLAPGPVIWIGVAILLLGISSFLTGFNFIMTIHKLRAPGLTWFRLPLFLWGTYVTAAIQVLATPVLGITLLFLLLEPAGGTGILDPKRGGDPLLFQHLFWLYASPAVYSTILPAMGIISELISTFSHKRIFGYKPIAYSSVAIALLSFLVWGSHMFVSGQSQYAGMIFSFLTFLVAIPLAIIIFNWLATLYGGSIGLKTPMLYALSFILLFSIGGLTGIFLGSPATNVYLHDTYFAVAHFHYVMLGGTTIAFIGGLHYWWPKIFGRMFNELVGKIGVALLFVGFNFTFFPQLLAGAKGMPRRYFIYGANFTVYNLLSTIGALLLGMAFLLVAFNLLHAVLWGKRTKANPWGALSLEWQAESPPVTENFSEPPDLKLAPYEFDRIPVDEA